jgi:hypothetical protein
MKFRQVEAELFHADRRTDGQTDMTNQIVALVISRKRLKTAEFTRRRIGRDEIARISFNLALSLVSEWVSEWVSECVCVCVCVCVCETRF